MTEPVFQNAWEHITLFFSGGLSWSIISYALQTFPQPKNPYFIWIMGVIQFAFANKREAQANFETAKLLTTGENKIP